MTERERNFTYTAAGVLRLAGAVCSFGWAKGYEATDKDGIACGLDNPNATCWCASSAITVQVHRATTTYREMREVRDRAEQAMVKAIRVLWPDADLYSAMYPDSPGYDHGRRCATPCDVIVNWNDKHERTQGEVVSALDRAAGMLYERVSVAAAEREAPC